MGRGAMGVVYKAFDPELERYAAIKVMMPSLQIDDKLRARFRREAKSVAKLNHPNIVSIYDIGQHDKSPFIAMEYVEGDDLKTLYVTSVCGKLYRAETSLTGWLLYP